MAGRRSRWSSLKSLMSRVFGGSEEKIASRRAAQRRALRLEPLEGRAMMAITNLGAIGGRVFVDATGNGYTPGEEVSGATVRLFSDDGDGIFEPGAGDTQLQSTTTNSQGNYQFSGLVAGSYWVQQIAQTIGSVTLPLNNKLQAVSSTDAAGTTGLQIDSYQTPVPSLSATLPTATANGSGTASEAVGGERDLVLNILSGADGDQVQFGVSASRLNLTADAGAVGQGIVTWDGSDGNATTLNPTGLGGIDLTSGGTSTGLKLTMGADHPNATAKTTLITNAGNSSSFTIAIPQITGSDPNPELFLPFSSFQVATGTGATLTSIGAIQVQIDTVDNGTDVRGELFGAVGPTVKSVNFDNPAEVDLVVAKTVDDSTPNKNQQITFTITVTNSSSFNATNVSLTDQLPTGLTFVSTDPSSNGSYNSTTGLWTVGTLNAQAAATLKIIATATGTVSSITNTATVTTVDQPESSTENNSASATVTPNIVDLVVAKTVDDSTPDKNQQVTFTITVTNSSNTPATNVQLTDQLPSGLTFVSTDPTSTGTYNSTTGVWTVGTLNAQAIGTLKITATATGTTTTQTNTATVTGVDQFETSTTNNSASATVTPNVVDLVVAKTVSDSTPDKNQQIVYTVTVTNNSQTNATNVQLTDQLPTGLTFVSTDPTSNGTYNSTTGVWTVGALNAQATATLKLNVTMAGPVTSAGQTFTNTATVSSVDQTESSTTNNTASVVVTPNAVDLALTKTGSASLVPTNSTVNFTIIVTNNSTTTSATNVQVTDLLPTGLTFQSVVSTSQGTYNSTTGVWTVGTLGTTSGQNSATLVVQAKMTATGFQTLTNTATITSLDQFDPTTGNNTASATVTNQILSKRNFLADTLV